MWGLGSIPMGKGDSGGNSGDGSGGTGEGVSKPGQSKLKSGGAMPWANMGIGAGGLAELEDDELTG